MKLKKLRSSSGSVRGQMGTPSNEQNVLPTMQSKEGSMVEPGEKRRHNSRASDAHFTENSEREKFQNFHWVAVGKARPESHKSDATPKRSGSAQDNGQLRRSAPLV